MLKKAGILVAAAAAGLIAVTPLAFAGDKDHDYDHKGSDSSTTQIDRSIDEDNDEAGTRGFLNENNVNVPIQACNNDVPVNVLGVQVSDATADLTGALGLLGDADAEDSSDNSENRSCEQGGAIADSDANVND